MRRSVYVVLRQGEYQRASHWKSGASQVDYHERGGRRGSGVVIFFDCDKIVNWQFFILTKRLDNIIYLLTYIHTY